MAGKHAIAGFEHLFERGKTGPIEAPIGVLHELFISLVVGVDGMKESLGISGVNRNRDAKACALVEDGIKTRIVRGNELASLVTNTEAEIFQDFQAASATGDGIVELVDHLLAEVGVVDFAPVNLCKDD